MIEFVRDNWTSIIPIIVSFFALFYSVKAWQKSRSIYGIERMVVRQYTGQHDDIYKNEDYINKKLSSGDYTILSVMERTKADKDWELLLGRITPYKNIGGNDHD